MAIADGFIVWYAVWKWVVYGFGYGQDTATYPCEELRILALGGTHRVLAGGGVVMAHQSFSPWPMLARDRREACGV